MDELFRSSDPKQETVSSVNTEAGIIFAYALRFGDLPAQDQQYLSQVVSARTGLSKADANKRVIDVFGDAKQSVETAWLTFRAPYYSSTGSDTTHARLKNLRFDLRNLRC